MNTYLMLLAALLPALLLFLYIWRKDPQPEPMGWLLKAVLYGVGICFPVAFLEVAINDVLGLGEPTNIIGAASHAFLVAAIPEESFKLLALWLLLRKNPFFDEHFDGIVYAVCIGLGFAALENVFYVIETENWLSVAVVRALLAVPGHYAFAILMGYYYSVYHFVNPSLRNAVCILLVPVMAHGIYDAIAMSGAVSTYIGSISFFVLVWFCIKMHKYASAKIVAQIKRDEQKPII
jgi:RsiW-degrading membrane proteinase PrsW (M82 family)